MLWVGGLHSRPCVRYLAITGQPWPVPSSLLSTPGPRTSISASRAYPLPACKVQTAARGSGPAKQEPSTCLRDCLCCISCIISYRMYVLYLLFVCGCGPLGPAYSVLGCSLSCSKNGWREQRPLRPLLSPKKIETRGGQRRISTACCRNQCPCC